MAPLLTKNNHCHFCLKIIADPLLAAGRRGRRVLISRAPISPLSKHLIPLSKRFLNTYCVHRPRHILYLVHPSLVATPLAKFTDPVLFKIKQHHCTLHRCHL